MRVNQSIRVFAACLIAILPYVVLGQSVVYVDADATGANDGSSWQDAFTDLQDGIAGATSGTQIWVAEGTYRPAGPGGDRTASFVLRPGVETYGGFLGNESSVDKRPTPLAVTTLSGDLLANDGDEISVEDPSREDNSFHVVTCAEAEPAEKYALDGVMVTGGNANRSGLDRLNVGGGFFCSGPNVEITNAAFHGNIALVGGGVWVLGGTVSMTSVVFSANRGGSGGGAFLWATDAEMDEVDFIGNDTSGKGAGMWINDGTLFAKNLSFVRNSGSDGAAVYVSYGRQWFVNIRAHQNTALFHGGAIMNDESHTVLVNAILSGNAADYGGAIVNLGASLEATNVTLVGNVARISGGGYFNWGGDQRIANTIIALGQSPDGPNVSGRVFENDTATAVVKSSLLGPELSPWFDDGGENIFTNPLFVDTLGQDGVPWSGDEDLHLLQSTPGVDAGDVEALPADSVDLDNDGDLAELIPLDVAGDPRVADGGTGSASVDMGALELAIVTNSREPSTLPEGSGPELSVFPNPTRDVINVAITGSGPTLKNIYIYDIHGRRLQSVRVEPGSAAFQVLTVEFDQPPGLYVVAVVTAAGVVSKPFIKLDSSANYTN